MVDLIVDQALIECRGLIAEAVKKLEVKEPPKPEIEHRSFGKQRHAGDAPR